MNTATAATDIHFHNTLTGETFELDHLKDQEKCDKVFSMLDDHFVRAHADIKESDPKQYSQLAVEYVKDRNELFDTIKDVTNLKSKINTTTTTGISTSLKPTVATTLKPTAEEKLQLEKLEKLVKEEMKQYTKEESRIGRSLAPLVNSVKDLAAGEGKSVEEITSAMDKFLSVGGGVDEKATPASIPKSFQNFIKQACEPEQEEGISEPEVLDIQTRVLNTLNQM
jgi:hypothetical protein